MVVVVIADILDQAASVEQVIVGTVVAVALDSVCYP